MGGRFCGSREWGRCPAAHRRCFCPSASPPRRRWRYCTFSHPHDRDVRGVLPMSVNGFFFQRCINEACFVVGQHSSPIRPPTTTTTHPPCTFNQTALPPPGGWGG